MRLKFVTFVLSGALGLAACEVTEPVVEKATPNIISISYDAYGSTPTLSAEAINIAVEHCKAQGGLFANYKGVSVPNPLFSAKEIHTFACERFKTDDSTLIAAQAQSYAAQSVATAEIIANSFEPREPTYTTCTTAAFHTTCTSY